ncbi:MAG TPA: helix-turn-helix transcriptional regulator [Pseudonocardiaceae bacterium]|nr:helix-turn-helix transcriptional regulator [Pseudonocardiaceae bacterium]
MTAAIAGQCARCGAPLSRYNPDSVCASCHPVEEARSPGTWLSRPTSVPAEDSGAVLRAWRASAGRSQAETAGLLGMTQQNLSQIENGRQAMSYEQRQRAVSVLGLSPEDLGLSPGRSRAELDGAVAVDQARWRQQRRWLNQHRSELARLAAKVYPPEHRVPGTPLIAGPGWIPDEPAELRSLRLTLDERPHAVTIDGSEDETLPTRPLCAPGQRFDRYTSAIRHLDPPRLFESRPSYRLLGGHPGTDTLRFGLAAYFDKIDVSEALGHELAIACHREHHGILTAVQREELPFRSLIGDPFDPARRAIIPAVTTLTIRLRRYPAEPSFLLHWRDPAKVATAAGVYDVIPAGEFQPASVALWDRRNDFDLWRNIVREYSEELLGTPEHDGTRTKPIDYHAWPLYRDLEDAQSAGAVVPFLLGLGLDALTLAATILTVVVIDDDVFARVFGAATRYNEEGEIVAIGDGRATEGIPFTEESVHRLLSREPMASPGAACLALAWRHRHRILGL